MYKKSETQSLNNDSTIQLQQKLIHYRSELSRHKQLIQKYRRELKQANTPTNRSNATNSHKTKKVETKPEPHVEAYFNYSIVLPNIVDQEKEPIIMGRFIIKNSSPHTLKNPLICLRITPTEAGVLGGKIATHARKTDQIGLTQVSERWEYVHKNWADKVNRDGEHWLRPLHLTELKPGEQFTFSNFDIRLVESRSKKKAVVVDGFTYFEPFKTGVAALNQIIVNF